MPEISFIDSLLYVSGQGAIHRIPQRWALCNVAAEVPLLRGGRSGHFPLTERLPFDDPVLIHGALRFITRHHANRRPVLIHCAAGVSRSVAIAWSYLIVARGFTMDEACTRLRQGRPCACPSLSILSSVIMALSLPFDPRFVYDTFRTSLLSSVPLDLSSIF